MFVINNEWWEAVLVPPLHPMLQKPDGEFTYGCCDSYTHTIYINNEIYGDFLKKVLCHELTHAAMVSYDVILSEEQEEVIADLIATYGREIIEMTNLLFSQIKGRYF